MHDILNAHRFSVITESKEVIDDLTEKDLETVIPRNSSTVKIVRGPKRNMTAEILKRNRKSGKLLV